MHRSIGALVAVAVTGLLATAVSAANVPGTPKNDVLRGSAKGDTLDGKAGNDKLYGLAGNDRLIGGAGNDLLVGGPGSDNLNCGPGKDVARADALDRISATCEAVQGLPPPRVTIAGATVVEGQSGTTTLSFSVALAGRSTKAGSVRYSTGDGTATAPADYTATSGTLTFGPGQTSKTITVPVVGDVLYEPDETVTVTLSNPVNLTIAVGTATGTITNDDTPATPGHYAGTTSQNESFDFDVTATGTGVTNVRTGQINQSCNTGGTVSGGRLNLTSTYPIAADGSFTIDVTLSGTISGGGQTAPLTGRLVITGRFSGQTASGTLLETTSFTLGGTSYSCTSNSQTWTATRTG